MSQLIWQIVKGNNAFLKKNKKTGAVFSTDPANPTNENRFRFSGLVRSNTVNVTTNAAAKEGSTHNLVVIAGQAGTASAKVGRLVGGKKGKSNIKGYKYNAQRINAFAGANQTRHSIRRAALARFSKLTAANKPVSAGRARSSR